MGTSAHLDGLFGMQGIGSLALSVAGSEKVKRDWLPKVARLEATAWRSPLPSRTSAPTCARSPRRLPGGQAAR